MNADNCVFHIAVVLSDEMVMNENEQRQYVDKNGDGVSDIVDGPTAQLLGFSKFKTPYFTRSFHGGCQSSHLWQS